MTLERGRAAVALILCAVLLANGSEVAQGQASPVPAPSGVPGASPAPSPTASPQRAYYARYAAVDLTLAAKVGNPIDPNLFEPATQSLRGALEYRFLGRSYVELEYRRWTLTHPSGGYSGIANGAPCNALGGPPPVTGNPGCISKPPGTSLTYLNAGRFTEQDVLINTSILRIGRNNNYLASSNLTRSNNYGYPTLSSNIGFGAERLIDPRKRADLFGYIFYFPEFKGKYALPDGSRIDVRYKALAWRAGAVLAVPKSPVFLEIGAVGDRAGGKENSPGNVSHTGFTLGFGGHF